MLDPEDFIAAPLTKEEFAAERNEVALARDWEENATTVAAERIASVS